jgi:hypothetical protein
VVTTLTTAGAARRAASLKLARPVVAARPAEGLIGVATITVAGCWARQAIDWIHCGLSVDTTKTTATDTVTVCEKINQSLRIDETTDSINKRGPP